MILLFKTKEKSKNENKQIFIIFTRNKQYKGQFFAASHHQEKLLTSPACYNKTAMLTAMLTKLDLCEYNKDQNKINYGSML